ncbi:phosphopantetheine-binding protein [Clostridium putrefaciens]|uniref:Phosphopantetheine-binding protein n=1 Tax=Clostridium putrefaciens TaxID=99675 RepID=A0A381J767_9CLOT|nr:hypothetical protein [Clostridium putrefaciens]SUY47134.1 phosphopantetheine-binding protein [Clostridium putrefaciens]
MTLEEIKEQYITALQEEIEEIDFSTIDCNESMMEKYGINSFYIVQMIICAEDTFDIFFEDEELITTNYKSLNDIFVVIQKKLEKA